MTKKKEEFHPLQKDRVSIYCCGVTPYSEPHIGNARPFVFWDVVRRFFKQQGFKVKYIQNFTDVDDKIINEANEEGIDWRVIADRYIRSYFESMDALNVDRADEYPRVSETMDDIIKMIETLIEKGYAYQLSNGDVFYSVEKFEGYGKLSGRKLEDMQAGARVDVDTRKHHPMDFALWKASKPGEPEWDSPWGKGRPGWHIECSTMSLKYLGEKFDFHGGGSDLIFPHHENEIAQSQACLGDDHSFAQYWVHNGFVTINNEKASKSTEKKKAVKSSFFKVQDILKKYPGEVVRFFIIGTHYRSPLDFSEDRLKEAKRSLARLQTTKNYIAELLARPEKVSTNTAQSFRDHARMLYQEFIEAMEDDFNTALALSSLYSLSKEINIYYQEVTLGREIYDPANFEHVSDTFFKMTDMLGILLQEEFVAEDDNLANSLMNLIIGIRQEARSNKNWALADEIRDALKELNIVLEDTPNGVKWKRVE